MFSCILFCQTSPPELIAPYTYGSTNLEKATDYDQRRRIRAQIRIVRRGEGRPEPGAKEAPKEREPTRPSTLVSKTKTPTPSAPPVEELDAEEDRKGKPRRPSQTRESPEKVPSLTRKPSRAEEVGGELTSPSVVAKLLPSSTSGE
ncbi:hypothetical protein J437_LFUL006889 [Ladona fulva]|uniref:Smoothelin domain-containing protein n=1 Tax=Ladona fulva TaxID=123851 RepID=A0A8K0KEW1_LADFU|nr:hypothetical protein J437_LFUL006889 [Ladona fulva]